MIPRDATLRVVRPTDNLEQVTVMYSKALGFEVLKQFKDHEGFDGVVLGHPKHAYHLEFIHQQGVTVGKAPSQDNSLVFYIDCSRVWERACRNMIDAGFSVVESNNPYWENVGKTFEDVDGYRVVLQNRDWDC
ncbi:VOC family protein [Photobacterium chitinilyticum]|uniref:Glyoxalase n=1 Tax=Photobacterium chitinilyticum TaxID=2485123 RepID=A0A3S3SY32_9GAMM|nr:VOC family protein [Photobacterium chitinilyticum]RWX54761.1 glyoxalase [Photobacterium chitinilyticum]